MKKMNIEERDRELSYTLIRSISKKVFTLKKPKRQYLESEQLRRKHDFGYNEAIDKVGKMLMNFSKSYTPLRRKNKLASPSK